MVTHQKNLSRAIQALFLLYALSPMNSSAGCLDEAPKESLEISQLCSSLGNFALNRGDAAQPGYENASDGLPKEHHAPMPPPQIRIDSLLKFTRNHSGRLAELTGTNMVEYCVNYYRGPKWDPKNPMDFLMLMNNRSKGFDRAVMKSVMWKAIRASKGNADKQITVRDLAQASLSLSEQAKQLGDEIFEDQLIPHAGSLEPSYRGEYLGKIKEVIASLNEGALNYKPSDCDYLNAPINHLYGLIQLMKLTAEMVNQSCPNEYQALNLAEAQKALSVKVAIDWKKAAIQAVGKDVNLEPK